MRRQLFVIALILTFVWAVIPLASAADAPALQAPVMAQVGSDGVQRATMILDSYSYQPNHLIVEAGKPVELTLTSVTTITPHNFVIKELTVEQDVSAGKTHTVKFTPAQAGTFAIYCDKKLLFFASHREKGMEGKLEVK